MSPKSSHSSKISRPYLHPRPLYPLLAALIAGIVAGDRWPDFVPTALALAAAGLLGTLAGIRSGRGARWLPGVLFAALGFLSIQYWNRPAPGGACIGPFLDGPRCTLIGTIIGRPWRYPGRTRFVLRAERVGGRDGVAVGCRARLRITVHGEDPGLKRGDRIRLTGRIRSFRNFDNPGGFDYRRYMRHRRIAGSLSLWSRRPSLVVKREHPTPVERLHAMVSAHLAASSDPGTAGTVFAALILGERSRIPAALQEVFQRVGVGHLLAISGLHVGIVAGIAYGIFRALLCRVPYFLWKGWVRKGAALLAFAPALGYAFLSGMSAPTQRAVVMTAAALCAVLLERERDVLHAVAMAALVIAAAHPPSVFSASFQLSFAAVLAIVAGIPVLAKPPAGPPAVPRLFLRRATAFAAVSLLAFFGTLPLVAAYFNQVSLIGPVSNLFYIPAVGFVAVPLGLAAVAAAPLAPNLAGLLVELDVRLLSVLLDTMEWVARMPYVAVKTPTPGVVEILCYYGAGSLMLLLWKMQRAAAEGSERAAAHRKHRQRLLWGVVLVAAVAACDALYWCRERFWRDELRLTVMDVGQGSAALVELPRGGVILVDGGGFSDNSRFDVGAFVVAPFLWRKKICTLDLVVLSHPNADHMNGLLYILRNFRVKEIWTNGESSETLGYARFCRIVKERKLFEPGFSTLPRRRRLNGATISILNPPRDFLQRTRFEPWRNPNNNSLAVHIRFGRATFLLPGDVMAAAEAEMVRTAGLRLDARVLVAPHHGSRFSATDAFLDAVRPSLVIFSAGANNRFGFPHAAVMQRCRRRGAALLRCDRDGAIVCSSDGKTLRLETLLLGRCGNTPCRSRRQTLLDAGRNGFETSGTDDGGSQKDARGR